MKEIQVYEGEVKTDIYGTWSDCSPGLYIGDDLLVGREGGSPFYDYRGKRIRITIEEVEEPNDNDDSG